MALAKAGERANEKLADSFAKPSPSTAAADEDSGGAATAAAADGAVKVGEIHTFGCVFRFVSFRGGGGFWLFHFLNKTAC